MSSRLIYCGNGKREVRSQCGWSRKGNPEVVDKLFKFHQKHCLQCKTQAIVLPSFNHAAAKINGQDGVARNGNKASELRVTCLSADKESLPLEVVEFKKSTV